MKKLLLTLAVACGAFALSSNAQVIITQNFDAAAAPALPAGWVQGSTGTPGWKTSATSAPTSTWGTATGTTPPAHSTQICLVDDWNDSTTTNLHDTLKSPVFSLAGSTSAWANYSYFFFNATRTSTGNTEKAYVIGSTDGGSTWSMLDTLDGWAFNQVWHTGHTSLASLGTGTNARIAFVYTDGADHLLGLALDSVEVINLTANSAAATALGYNNISNGISANGQSLAFMVMNTGIPITSLTAKYTINGGAPVTQTFTGLSISPYTSTPLTFTTAMSGAVATSLNTVNVVITAVNSAANMEVDSTESSTFTLASATTQRQGLVEEFSSSTCAPCKAFNQNYDPFCITYNVNATGTNVNVIKYQMNWPSPGTDRSYNNDGLTRRTYYNCNSIPEHFVNGTQSTASSSPFVAATFTTEMDNSKLLPSFLDMTVTYNVDTVRKKLGVLLNVTPHFTKSGGYHVYIAVMDKHYQNTTNTTGQLEYYHVMRKMLPSGSGHPVTSWTDGVAQSFVDTGIAYTNGDWTAGSATYPVQMDNKMWSNPFTGSEVIAFVEEDATKSVMQSIWTLPAGASINVSTLAKVEGIEIFPNPTKGEANLKFNLQENGNVRVSIMDYTGKMISEVANQNMSIGMQNVKIATNGIVPGNYIVLISTESGNRAERLTVE